MTTCNAPDCTRPARWVICGRNHDGDVLVTVYACDDAMHLAARRGEAWLADRVAVVSTDRISKTMPATEVTP